MLAIMSPCTIQTLHVRGALREAIDAPDHGGPHGRLVGNLQRRATALQVPAHRRDGGGLRGPRALGLLLCATYGFAIGSLPVLVVSALGLLLSSTIRILLVRGSRARPA